MIDRTVYVDALRARLAEVTTAVEQDREQVHALLEGIKNKEEQIEYIVKLLAAEGVCVESETNTGSAAMSVSDMAFEVFRRRGDLRPIHYRELLDLITADGKTVPGQNPAANLVAHMSRDARFVRTGRGIYGLAEWGLKAAKKPVARRPRRRTHKASK